MIEPWWFGVLLYALACVGAAGVTIGLFGHPRIAKAVRRHKELLVCEIHGCGFETAFFGYMTMHNIGHLARAAEAIRAHVEREEKSK